MRRPSEYFGEAELDLVHMARRLSDALALEGLLTAAGIDYLVATQRADGSWHEDQFTGTGFPKVFYLKYHMYRLYFPLMALSRYARAGGTTLSATDGERL